MTERKMEDKNYIKKSIELAEYENKDESQFKQYELKELISRKIFDDFIKLYQEEKGFPFDDKNNNDKFGIISNAMGLSTILELDALGANITSKEAPFKFLIEYIFNSVRAEDGEYKFSAEPYISIEKSSLDIKEEDIDTYTETMSKVLIIMLDLRSKLVRDEAKEAALKKRIDSIVSDKKPIKIRGKEITSNRELRSEVENLIIKCVEKLNENAITNVDTTKFVLNNKEIERDRLSSEIKYKGWTYKKPDLDKMNSYDPSIYFTYHATNAFISLYVEFQYFFDYKYKTFKRDEIESKNPAEMGTEESYIFKVNQEFFNEHAEKLNQLRYCTSSAARYFYTRILKNEIDLSFDYIGENFKPISYDMVMNSQRNNYVIDTIFVLGILVNGGVDDDYDSIDDKKYIYEQLNYAFMNVRKIYSIMKRSKKEDFISSYRIIFNEKYPTAEQSRIQDLRKKFMNIPVYDFVPLLCNIYSIVSKYLIKYPQKDIVDNLEWVLENRNDYRWVWDRESFNVNNNLYYIFALENFYEYYEENEKIFIKNAVDNVYDPVKEKENEIKLKKEKIAELDRTIKERDVKIQELENKTSDLDNAVITLIKKYYSENIEKSIEKYLELMVEENNKLAVALSGEDLRSNFDPNKEKYKKAILLLKMAYAFDAHGVAKNLEIMDESSEDLKKLTTNVNRSIYSKLTN